MVRSTNGQNKVIVAPRESLENSFEEYLDQVKEPGSLHPLSVIVDSNLTGVYLRRMLAGKGRSHLNLSFLTFADLAYNLGAEYLSKEQKALPYYGKERIIQKIVSQIPEASYYAPVSRYAGFKEALLRTFQEVREAGLQHLDYIAKGDKGKELGKLYEEYNKMLEPFYDEVSIYQAALTVQPEELPWNAFFIYGVNHLNQEQKNLLVHLSRYLPTYVFVQPYLKTQSFGQDWLQWFRDQGFSVEEDSPVLEHNISRREYLQNRICFNYSSPLKEEQVKEGQDDSLEIWSAPEEIEEVRGLARHVIRLARQGYCFREMAVLTKDPGYITLLNEVFSHLGIPVYHPAGIPLQKTSTGKTLGRCFQLVRGQWERSEVMELVFGAPFDFRGVVGGQVEPSPLLWDYLSREAGVTRGLDSWIKNLNQLNYRYRKLEEGDGKLTEIAYEEDKIAEDRGKITYTFYRAQILQLIGLVKKLHYHLESFPEKSSWGKMVDHVEELMQKFFLDDIKESEIEEGEKKEGDKKEGDKKEGDKDEGKKRQVILRYISYLRSLASLEDEVCLSEALDLMKRVIDEATVPGGDYSRQGITVCPLPMAVNLSYKIIFLPGMLEKNYPIPFRSDPIILEEERKRTDALPLRREELQHQELNFLQTLGSSTDKLYLTFPRHQAGSGKEQLPSQYLLKVAEMLTGSNISLDQLDQLPGFRRISSLPLREQPEQAITLGEFDQAVSLNLSEDDLKVYFKEVRPWLPKMLEREEAMAQPDLNAYQGILLGENARILLRREHNPFQKELSVSYLKSYFHCPYQFFWENVMRIMPLEEPEERMKINNMEKGALMHRTLEKFFGKAHAHSLLPLTEKILPEAKNLMEDTLNEIFLEFEKDGLTGYPLLWKIDQEQIRYELMGYLQKEALKADGFCPGYFEVRFGSNRENHEEVKGFPLTIELPRTGKKLCFRGRIDRLDLGPGEQVRVIDYKTGRNRINTQHLEEKISLQLSIYLLAVKNIFGDKPLDQILASYVYLSRSENYPEIRLRGTQFYSQEDLLKEVLEVFSGLLYSGYFGPDPDHSCSYCHYSLICGPGLSRVMQNKQDDPLYLEYQRLKEVLLHE